MFCFPSERKMELNGVQRCWFRFNRICRIFTMILLSRRAHRDVLSIGKQDVPSSGGIRLKRKRYWIPWERSIAPRETEKLRKELFSSSETYKRLIEFVCLPAQKERCSSQTVINTRMHFFPTNR